MQRPVRALHTPRTLLPYLEELGRAAPQSEKGSRRQRHLDSVAPSRWPRGQHRSGQD
ncbi:hypothetical protein D9M72_416270 [compost metagenome]